MYIIFFPLRSSLSEWLRSSLVQLPLLVRLELLDLAVRHLLLLIDTALVVQQLLVRLLQALAPAIERRNQVENTWNR